MPTGLHHCILNSIEAAIHSLDLDGRITFANVPAAKLLGWSVDELIGQPQHDLLHHSRPDGSKYPASECPILQALKNGVPHRHANEVFWRKDGKPFAIDYFLTPLHDAGVVVGGLISFRDATEERRVFDRQLAEERAARTEVERLTSELKRVFMQVPAAFCTTRGPAHLIDSVNPPYQQLVGAGSVIGKAEVFSSSPAHRRQLDAVYSTGVPYTGSEVARVWDRGNGVAEPGFVNFAYQALHDADGRIYGLVGLIVDVTELVQSRNAAEQHAEEMKRLGDSLARINRELDQFAYVASHDLKAPLRGIASLASWIDEDMSRVLDESSKKNLELLRGRVVRMEALIDGLLEYSRAGRVRSRIDTVNVAELLREVVEMLAPPADASVAIGAGMPTIETEVVALQQVFLNLLGNAIKHAGRADPRVEVRVRDAGEFYEFSIQDNGPGIAREFHSKVWEMFQTLQPRDTIEGAGMGLALVQKNVESRGGRVTLDSEPGHGATFSFLWPKRPEQDF